MMPLSRLRSLWETRCSPFNPETCPWFLGVFFSCFSHVPFLKLLSLPGLVFQVSSIFLSCHFAILSGDFLNFFCPNPFLKFMVFFFYKQRLFFFFDICLDILFLVSEFNIFSSLFKDLNGWFLKFPSDLCVVFSRFLHPVCLFAMRVSRSLSSSV